MAQWLRPTFLAALVAAQLLACAQSAALPDRPLVLAGSGAVYRRPWCTRSCPVALSATAGAGQCSER